MGDFLCFDELNKVITNHVQSKQKLSTNMLNTFTTKKKTTGRYQMTSFTATLKPVAYQSSVFTAEAEPLNLSCKKVFLNI